MDNVLNNFLNLCKERIWCTFIIFFFILIKMNIFQEVFAAAIKKQAEESHENSQAIANTAIFPKTETKKANSIKIPESKQKVSQSTKPVKDVIPPKPKKEPVKQVKKAKTPATTANKIVSSNPNPTSKANSMPAKKQPLVKDTQKIQIQSPPPQEIEETQERIQQKKDELSSLELELMNTLNEIKELKSAIKEEKEKTKELKAKNKQLMLSKEMFDQESKQYNDDIMTLLMDNKEELQKKEEIWEYKYNELLCEQENYSDLI